MHAKSFDSLFFINYYVKTGPLSSNESLQSDLYPFDEKISVLRVVLPFELSLLYWIKINPIIRREVILINLLFLSFAFWNSFRDILFFFFFLNAFIRKLVLSPHRIENSFRSFHAIELFFYPRIPWRDTADF